MTDLRKAPSPLPLLLLCLCCALPLGCRGDEPPPPSPPPVSAPAMPGVDARARAVLEQFPISEQLGEQLLALEDLRRTQARLPAPAPSLASRDAVRQRSEALEAAGDEVLAALPPRLLAAVHRNRIGVYRLAHSFDALHQEGTP